MVGTSPAPTGTNSPTEPFRIRRGQAWAYLGHETTGHGLTIMAYGSENEVLHPGIDEPLEAIRDLIGISCASNTVDHGTEFIVVGPTQK